MMDPDAVFATAKRRMCIRCVMDESVPGIRFDDRGICSYCHLQDRLERAFPTGPEGRRVLERLAERMRRAGRGRAYDCVVGVSGGRDTSYCLHYVKRELGLRPLAVHFDNGWDAETAKTNLARLCAALDVDLHTVIMDWPDSQELTNCTIRAGVPYIDVTDDIGIASSLYRTAAREGVRYIVMSHSFREEGVTPLLWNYIDGRYVRALIRRYATRPLKTFRNVDLHHLLWWTFVKRIRVVNITNYYDDTGEKVEKLLEREYGWVDTGQHHMDNELFALVYHYARHKFGFDWRVVELSAKVRCGVITRDQALDALSRPPFFETEEMVTYCLEKQGMSRQEYEAILRGPNRYFTDFPSWYPLLRAFRLPIRWLCRVHMLPEHAYEKFFETI